MTTTDLRTAPQDTDPPGRRRRLPRRATEIGVILIAAMLVMGTVVGIALSRNLGDGGASGVADGLAWLADRPAGDAVQINPANGRPEGRLAVADPGAAFEIAQRDGLLVVMGADGQLTTIDVATLGVLGGYRASPARSHCWTRRTCSPSTGRPAP